MDIDKTNRSSPQTDSFEVFSSSSLKTNAAIKKEIKKLSFGERFKRHARPKPVSKDEYQQIVEELRQVNPNETVIWMGRSTQLIHIAGYILCFLFFWLLFPLVLAYVLFLQTKRTIYVLTNERLCVYSGIFVKRIDDVELYRVKDTIFLQPFLLGRFGFSHIQLITSDPTWGNSLIRGVSQGRLLREKIRSAVEFAREKKGVRELDSYTHGNIR